MAAALGVEDGGGGGGAEEGVVSVVVSGVVRGMRAVEMARVVLASVW